MKNPPKFPQAAARRADAERELRDRTHDITPPGKHSRKKYERYADAAVAVLRAREAETGAIRDDFRQITADDAQTGE